MTTYQWLMMAVALGGNLVTIVAVLLSNARRSGRVEEGLRGLGKALDNHRAANAQDHSRYDRELADLQSRMATGGR